MNKYAWPARVEKDTGKIVLVFPDWEGIAVSGTTGSEAARKATEALSQAVLVRIEADASVPAPSELQQRQILVYVTEETAARVDAYLESRDEREFRKGNELEKIQRDFRTAYLTEREAHVGRLERLTELSEGSVREFASIGIRFAYILNAGGLVAVPAIMELLPKNSGSGAALLAPAVIFVVGILAAAVTNFLAYRSSAMISEGYLLLIATQEMEISGIYYPPDDPTTHEGEIEELRQKNKKMVKLARRANNWAVWTFGGAIASFLLGVASAIIGLW